MTYKDMFDQAFDSLGNSKMRMTDSEFSAAVRAKAKKNTVVVGNGRTLHEIPVSREPHSQHKLRNAVFGIAGTAAVLAGAVFGLKFLNEHGGLKEGGIDTDTSTGAGYSQNVTAEPEDTTAVMPAGSETSDDYVQPDIDSAEKKEYEAQLKELNDTKEYYENEFEALESAKKEEALTITYLTQEKEKLTEELTRLQLLGEDTSAVEQDIKSVEEKIGQHEILLDSFSEEAEKIYDKLGVVKMQIAKIEAEMKGHIFYEFGDDEPEVTEETTVKTNILDGAETSDRLKTADLPVVRFDYDDLTLVVIGYEFDGSTMNLYYDVRFNEDSGIEKDRRMFSVPHIQFLVFSEGSSRASVLSEDDSSMSMVTTMTGSEPQDSVVIHFLPSDITGTVPNDILEKYTFTAMKNADKVVPALGKGSKIEGPASETQSFDSFAAAGEVYGRDLLDFGVGEPVYTAHFAGCDIIQAYKYNVDGIFGNELVSAAVGNSENKSEKPELIFQTAIIADTPEKRITAYVDMTKFDPDSSEHSSYYSEKLGTNVDLYYGKKEKTDEEPEGAFAFFEYEDVLYNLVFENCGGIIDVESTAKRVTENDIARTGYYEGEVALNILKQYAGEDYCFPLEDWKKEVITYRTCDPSTVEHSRTDYRFNIPAESGEPILAVTGGTVIGVSPDVIPDKGEGVNITIQAADGRKWRYSHLSDYFVSEGDTVKSGDRIAAVGATGWCTGPLVCISFPDSEVIDPAVTTE